jgi:hypothetical protein
MTDPLSGEAVRPPGAAWTSSLWIEVAEQLAVSNGLDAEGIFMLLSIFAPGKQTAI